ncbi:Acyl-coenzyme A synthetase ACSM5, mitochondrial, partial [Ophiophagus hannah]
MKLLVRCFGHLQTPWVFLHQAKRCVASLIPSYYEAVNRGDQEVPEYFNFASDVVDKWMQEEKLTAKDISYRIQASKAKGIVVAEQSVDAVDSIIAEWKFLKTKLVVSDRGRAGWLRFNDLLQAASGDHDCIKTRSEELMLIYFTSGSTGSPKMVEHCHSSYGIGFTSSGR